MSEKISIEVFGIKDLQTGGGCSCSGGCGPVKTMGEVYDELVEFLSKVNVKGRIETRFIDMLEDNIDEYKFIKNAEEQGYTLPLTAINGTLKFYGGISNEMTYDEIKKLI